MSGWIIFLEFIEKNWPFLLIILACVINIYFQWKKYAPLTREQKIQIALKTIQETILKRVSLAEIDWSDFQKTGSIKRAQVIAEIYEEYPILKEYSDQEALTKLIDDYINESLKEVREIIKNKST